jgi:hypothetical protein
MMTDRRKRLIRDLVVTGIAAPLVIVVLIVVHAARGLVWALMPILYLGRAISALIERLFPPQGGGWFEGLGTTLMVDFVLAWIAIWIVLFAMLKLMQKWIDRKKREA